MGELSRSRVCYWDLCWRIDRNTTTDKRDSAPSNNRQDDTNENDQQSSPITVHNKRDYETDSESEDKPGKRRRSARIAARHGSSSNTWVQGEGIDWINQSIPTAKATASIRGNKHIVHLRILVSHMIYNMWLVLPLHDSKITCRWSADTRYERQPSWYYPHHLNSTNDIQLHKIEIKLAVWRLENLGFIRDPPCDHMTTSGKSMSCDLHHSRWAFANKVWYHCPLKRPKQLIRVRMGRLTCKHWASFSKSRPWFIE